MNIVHNETVKFEALFVSAAHGEEEIDRTLEAAEDFLTRSPASRYSGD